jgi:hypothetical protein
VSRTGGRALSSEFVEAASFVELTGDPPSAAAETTSNERKQHGFIDQ